MIIYNIISRVEYSFINLLLLMDALVKVVAARNPFFLFGSGYISLGNITFEIDDEENVHGLWLNYKENVPPVNEPLSGFL